MKIGVTLRNMGPQSTAQIMLAVAQAAERRGYDSVWITDHIAIPPDDAEGSGGRYTDPLTTLAWLGGATQTIGLGVGVLVIPYREALATAKAVATVHELTGERLILGAAVGWMDPEFRAVGVDRHQRGKITDETLGFLQQCFANEVVERHGQPFLFKPRPAMPPLYVGGSAPHALHRAVRLGCGWLPMARDPERLQEDLQTFASLAKAADAAPGPVTVMTGLPLAQTAEAAQLLGRYAELGVERLVCAMRYDTLAQYEQQLDALLAVKEQVK